MQVEARLWHAAESDTDAFLTVGSAGVMRGY